jgi:hypothetical protein
MKGVQNKKEEINFFTEIVKYYTEVHREDTEWYRESRLRSALE